MGEGQEGDRERKGTGIGRGQGKRTGDRDGME